MHLVGDAVTKINNGGNNPSNMSHMIHYPMTFGVMAIECKNVKLILFFYHAHLFFILILFIFFECYCNHNLQSVRHHTMQHQKTIKLLKTHNKPRKKFSIHEASSTLFIRTYQTSDPKADKMPEEMSLLDVHFHPTRVRRKVQGNQYIHNNDISVTTTHTLPSINRNLFHFWTWS